MAHLARSAMRAIRREKQFSVRGEKRSHDMELVETQPSSDNPAIEQPYQNQNKRLPKFETLKAVIDTEIREFNPCFVLISCLTNLSY